MVTSGRFVWGAALKAGLTVSPGGRGVMNIFATAPETT